MSKLILALLLLAPQCRLIGETAEYEQAYQAALERARQEAAQKAAAKAYPSAFAAAKEKAYEESRKELTASGAYRYNGTWLLAVVALAAGVGFLCQYRLIGKLRREGSLRGDIDRALLGSEYAFCKLRGDADARR